MNTSHLKISFFIGLFLTFVGSLSAQDEVDYGARFYEIKYSSDLASRYPKVDSVEILDIYGNIHYAGPNRVRLSSDCQYVFIGDNDWMGKDVNGNIALNHPEQPFVSGCHISCRNGKYGLCNQMDNILIPFEYNYLREPELPEIKSYIAKKNEKYGLIDEKNKSLLPFEYDYISFIINPFGEFIAYCEKDSIVSFADVNTGKILSKSNFSEAFIDDKYGDAALLIPVRDADTKLWGCMDYNGKIVIPCKYVSYVFDFTGIDWNNLGFVWPMQKSNELWDVLDNNGRILIQDCQEVYCDVDTIYHIIFAMKDSVLSAYDAHTGKKKYSVGNLTFRYTECNYAVVGKNWKWGVLDMSSGKVIIPCQYDYIHLNNKKKEVLTAACLKYEDDTVLDYIRLVDGKITHSYNNYSGREGSGLVCDRAGARYSWGCHVDWHTGEGINVFNTKSGYVCIVSYDGSIIIDESRKIQGYSITDLFSNVGIHNGYIYTNKGIFDITGALLSEGILSCWVEENGCILFNNKTNDRECFACDNGRLIQVESFDAIYRYYYTQCQEKFRKQPSDVDKNIPETNTTNSNTYAFIIANEDYPSAPVPYGLNDGRSFKTYCEKTLGIPANHVILFENATQGKINSCVEQMKRAASANNGDIDILFYYAGHAFPDEETKSAYLLPIDGDVTIPATGYSLDKLYGELGQLNVNSVMCFIDACFSGVTRDDNTLLAGRAVIVQPKNSEPRGNMVVFTAAQGTETAHQYQAKKHGMFTYYLLKKLQESKGEVTLGELADYLNSNVKKMSFEVNSKLQTPKVLVSPAMELKWRTLKLDD